jgi:hypothetical protein
VSVVVLFAETKPPEVRFKIEPEYTKQARKAKLQGLAVLSLVIDTRGNPKDISVAEKARDKTRQDNCKAGALTN